jgi:hypothetical protein
MVLPSVPLVDGASAKTSSLVHHVAVRTTRQDLPAEDGRTMGIPSRPAHVAGQYQTAAMPAPYHYDMRGRCTAPD